MTTFEIISLILNFLLAGGGLTMFLTLRSTIRKAREDARQAHADADRTELENDRQAAQTLMEYIVEPLKKEINALRKDVRRLQRAVEAITDCPHADSCPVRRELQNDKNNS